ncbi:signal recognition particle protein [Alkaliphilus peptidifermentans]|uniref:Signal recognition particle protein n=1 Tax=Alkaliphilus peptidifermentans DSM 18978 TaxID=1120976 RepID=A0A1G5JAB3_9FIRM|nr:signal recognition particle protein [Alkaliphilus peptidifermentans]SCY84759.1 signal recognition particle subunit FFH/SRP54 (srp54) [Alkaliphilus peptidifermentans DSM 18978]
MVFEGLAEKLQNTLHKLKGKGKVNEKDVNDAMREVKMALLEADVNFKVVKDFVNKVKERAIGAEVLESLTPGQQIIKIVNDELTILMGTTQSKINFSSKPPTVIMLVGLQGAGKTTTGGKLAKLIKKQGKRPLLIAADIYRPAAIKQLQVVGGQVDVPVFSMGDKQNPVDIAKAGLEHAISNGNDVIIVDTAGRLHIDDELMGELQSIKSNIKPHEILLVVDSMTGQDAVNVAEHFNEKLGIDGVILTKLDGDTRGGAALSVRAVTNKPIKFAALGEKLDDIEIFHPDRMASRILGMGDVLSLIEKAQANFDEKKAKELENKIKTQSFTFDDFLDQLQQMKNMGPISQLLEMIPGAGKQLKGLEVNEKELVHIQAIIQSMTKQERQNPSLLNGSRRKRIAAGSGTSVQQVNRLLKQFEQTRKMMKQFADMDKGVKKGGKFKLPFGNKF